MTTPAETPWLPPQDTANVVSTANAGVVRYLQDGVTPRLEQDGATQRVLQDDVITPTPTTIWSEDSS